MRHSTKDVIEANIALHTHLVGNYKETEPHYLPENIRHVDGIIRNLSAEAPGGALLDVGCGSGFIIDIAKHHFQSIHGIDVTPAMLEKVDRSATGCYISVQLGQVEAIPFPDATFDVVTAYAVLHHLSELTQAFKEIARVLKPGGIFYSDLDPNFYFWDAFNQLPEAEIQSDFVLREFNAVRHKDDELEATLGVDPSILHVAETMKHEEGGFKAEDLHWALQTAGFTDIQTPYFWFLGEANTLHGDTPADADAIRSHLMKMLPLSRHLFKYVGIWARK